MCSGGDEGQLWLVRVCGSAIRVAFKFEWVRHGRRFQLDLQSPWRFTENSLLTENVVMISGIRFNDALSSRTPIVDGPKLL